MAFESTPIPWSIRQKLLNEIRSCVGSHGKGTNFHEVLARGIEQLAQSTKHPELRRLVNLGLRGDTLAQAFRTWAPFMPATHRSEWLLDRISDVGNLTWLPEPPPVTGPVPVSRRERDAIQKRLDRLYAKFAKKGDAPDREQVADLVMEELERIAQKNETFAIRALTVRFPDQAGTKTLSFRDLLAKLSLPKVDDVLRVIELSLEITWTIGISSPDAGEVAPPPPERDPVPYSATATFQPGDKISHTKFGLGTVLAVEPGRVKIRFGETERTLARS